MDIGIAVFAYNRSAHLEKVLKALERNKVTQKIYFFQDGLKNSYDKEEWDKVHSLIKRTSWEDSQYIISSQNKGCASSIEDGIAYVLTENDAIIVLEDDCVPHPDFIEYMNCCLERYADEQIIAGVSGYAWPIEMKKNKYDIYLCGRTSSWGWGTWRNRWKEYVRDCDLLKRIYGNQEASSQLGIWGEDLEEMLVETVRCNLDAWDVFWALHVIEKGMYYLNPYQQLISNIGLDGTGLHCGHNDIYYGELESDRRFTFELPQNISEAEKCEIAFSKLYNGYSHASKKNAPDILVWGIGNFYRKHKKGILKEYNVLAFIDQRKIKFFEGKRVIKPCSICEYQYDYILIMIADSKTAKEMRNSLIKNIGVSVKKILLGEEIFY